MGQHQGAMRSFAAARLRSGAALGARHPCIGVGLAGRPGAGVVAAHGDLAGGHYTDCGTDGCLFDIRGDPTEQHNVAGKNPEVVAELRSALAAHVATYFQTPMGELDCSDPRLQAVLASGRWQPFED